MRKRKRKLSAFDDIMFNMSAKDDERQLYSKLRTAINAGDHKTFQRLVKGGVAINRTFWYDSTLLHEVVSMSNIGMVKTLITAGAEVNRTNQDGRTPLHLACRGGHVDIVHALIAAGTDVNKRTLDGKTCLHVAVWRGHREVVEQLVKAGANVNIPDSEGCTSVYWAARSNYLAILDLLVKAGGKVNYVVKSKWTPLHSALKLGHMSVVRYLIVQGAETNISVEKKTVVSLLVDNRHLPQEVRQDTLDMLITGGYNLHRDPWRPGPTPKPAASSPPSSSSSSLPQAQRLRRDDKAEKSAEFLASEAMGRWLDLRRERLPTLTCLCRTRLRKRLSYCSKGRSIVDVIPQLPLPALMANFVGFKGDAALDQGFKELDKG